MSCWLLDDKLYWQEKKTRYFFHSWAPGSPKKLKPNSWWSEKLHDRFVDRVNHLGAQKVSPFYTIWSIFSRSCDVYWLFSWCQHWRRHQRQHWGWWTLRYWHNYKAVMLWLYLADSTEGKSLVDVAHKDVVILQFGSSNAKTYRGCQSK